MCVGAGGNPGAMSDGKPIGMDWGHIDVLKLNADVDHCETSPHFYRVTLNNGTKYIVTASSFNNVPVFDEVDGRMTFNQIHVDLLTSNRPCPIKPRLVYMPEDDFEPPFLVPVPSNHGYNYTRGTKYDNITLSHGMVMLGYELFRTGKGCSCQSRGMTVEVSLPIECLPYHYVTKYGIPGSNIIRDSIILLIDILVDVTSAIADNIWSWFEELFVELNSRFKLLESLTVLGAILWRSGNPWKSGVAVVAYVLFVGVTRD